MRACILIGLSGIFLLLSACQPTEDREDNRSQERVAPTLEQDIENISGNIENDVSPLAENLTGSESDAGKAIDQGISEQLKGGDLSENVDPAANKLIESMGFADAQTQAIDLLPNNGKKEEYQPFCNRFSGQADSENVNTIDLATTRESFCNKISRRLASVSNQSCLTAKLTPTGCDSVDGVPLMMREFSPVDGKKPLGKVLIIGGTHGDELTSVSVTFRWIEKLNTFHSGLFHWHIIPSMNPDGLLPRSAQRTNHNGVDLNRNMPSDDWEQNALDYWHTKGGKNPRKFPGDQANSEPETRWLVDEIELFKPDAIIAVHAPYGVVDFDALQLNTAPKSLGKLHLNLLGTYPGSLGNYAGINRNIPVITLELPHAWEMPSQKDSDLIWQDIVGWLKKTFEARKLAETSSD